MHILCRTVFFMRQNIFRMRRKMVRRGAICGGKNGIAAQLRFFGISCAADGIESEKRCAAGGKTVAFFAGLYYNKQKKKNRGQNIA